MAKKQAPQRGIASRLKNPYQRKTVHKYGQAQLRKGTHPQMWRAKGIGGKLGPMGELGDDVIIEITFKHAIKDAWETTRLTESETKTLIQDLIYDPLEEFLIGKIDTWVPKDTGNLRRQLKSVLSRSFGTIDEVTTNIPFRVLLGTPKAPYANVVNKMPEEWLQHPGSHPQGEVGRRKKLLDDPEAKKGWYNLLLLNGRRKAQRLYGDFLENGIIPLIRTAPKFAKNPASKVRNLFKVKFK